MRYHGLYCGPNWSDGKVQLSVANGQPAVDELDELCKVHDARYATASTEDDLIEADRDFARAAISLGWPKSVVAGIAVGAQYLSRKKNIRTNRASDIDKNMARKITNMKKDKQLSRNGPLLLAPPLPTPRMNKAPGPSQPGNSTITAVPSAYAITSKMSKPKTYVSKDGGVILKHRGLVAGFVGSTTFTAKNFQVNPGLGSVFPWCSQLARSYDKYRFRKLKFEFRSVVPTTTAGVVMMSFDYDTLDTLPATKFEHAQTTPNVESNAFNSFELVVQCDNTFRFIRQGSIANTDLKTYDFGQLVISSSYSVAALVGEIYVDYEVELAKPSHGVAVSVSGQQLSPPAVNVPWGTNMTLLGSAQPAYIGTSGSTIVFSRPGEYLITAKFVGTVFTAIAIPTLVAGYSAGAAVKAFYASVINAAQTSGLITFAVRVGVGDSLECSGMLTATTLTQSYFAITETEYSPP